ncbi:MAG TPA: ABC transporter substrate-binding protein [Stellaceae bacterium]|jgi:phospholipid transport system substrate-binding protein|nr:ABC transporter substrate-binding protein [Stellaceae bacterium]
MKRSLSLTAASLLIVGILLPARPAAAAADPAAVITSLGNEALKVLGRNVDPNVRVARFRELFSDDFDVPGIARFVLGRYWRLATPDQQQEFIRLFTNYIAFVYSNELAEYSGETLRVTGTRAAPDGQLVSSEIMRTNGQPPAPVDWLLVPVDGAYKIRDVIVESVSMAVTQRSEFASVIQRNGGQVQGLIIALRQKTESAGLR